MTEDALVKMGLEVLLSPFVEVQTQVEVQPPSQYVDVFVATETTIPEAMWQSLGWLGRMAASPTMIEAFSGVVSESEARDCLRKQLTWHHTLELSRAQAQGGGATLALPPLWLLSCGQPRALLASWGMAAVEGWPAGFYRTPPGFGVWVVALPELPTTRETLPLRLFGDARVRQSLPAEIGRMSPDDPMRRLVAQMLLRWGLWLRGQPQDEAARRFLVNFEQVVQAELGKIKAEHLRTGIADMCELLGIELTAERRAHLASLGVDGLESLRLALKERRTWPDT